MLRTKNSFYLEKYLITVYWNFSLFYSLFLFLLLFFHHFPSVSPLLSPFLLLDRVSLHSPSGPGTHYVDQIGLKFTKIFLPLPFD